MKSDMVDCIFNPQKDNNLSIEKTDGDQNSYFTITDHADFTDNDGNKRTVNDNENVYAKRIIREDNSIKYSIKIDTKGKLFNPISIYGQDQSNNFLDKTCKDSKFRTVNFKTFEMYIKFLNTKNLSWLYNAEREAE
jgi:hypothetical protein